jgi:DNA-binding transcriptional regulator YhcF (GntR family)
MKSLRADTKVKFELGDRKKEIAEEVENITKSKKKEELEQLIDKMQKQEFNKDMIIDYFVSCGKDRDLLVENYNK